MDHKFTTQTDQIELNEVTQQVRLFKLWSVYECGVCETPEEHNSEERNRTKPASSVPGRSSGESAVATKAHACAEPLKTPAGGGRKHPEKTRLMGHRAVHALSPPPPKHTNRDSWGDVLWTDESELLGHQKRRDVGPCNVIITQKHSSKSTKDWLGTPT